eukprot:1346027-Alexandrium_andersonii.AAC.1
MPQGQVLCANDSRTMPQAMPCNPFETRANVTTTTHGGMYTHTPYTRARAPALDEPSSPPPWLRVTTLYHLLFVDVQRRCMSVVPTSWPLVDEHTHMRSHRLGHKGMPHVLRYTQ